MAGETHQGSPLAVSTGSSVHTQLCEVLCIWAKVCTQDRMLFLVANLGDVIEQIETIMGKSL